MISRLFSHLNISDTKIPHIAHGILQLQLSRQCLWCVVISCGCINLVIAVLITSAKSCPLLVLHVLFQMSSEYILIRRWTKSYCKHRKPWTHTAEGTKFDISEINILHWRNCLLSYKATTRCFTEWFLFFWRKISINRWCCIIFLLLRYDQNNFLSEMKVDKVAKSFWIGDRYFSSSRGWCDWFTCHEGLQLIKSLS